MVLDLVGYFGVKVVNLVLKIIFIDGVDQIFFFLGINGQFNCKVEYYFFNGKFFVVCMDEFKYYVLIQ